MKTFQISLGTLALSALVSLTTQAQVVIFSENFDPLSGGASLTQYTFGDTGAGSSAGVVAGVGVDGSAAFQIVNTAPAGGSAGYSGIAGQYQNGVVAGNTSLNLSDYTLSFDAKATAGSLNIQIQTWPQAHFGGTMTGTLNTAPSAGYGNDQTLNSTWTHYSLNLGNSAIFATVGSGFQITGGTIQVAMQFNGGGATPYSNTLDVDNLTLTMATVPEPSSLALCGLAAAAGLILRRRTV